ncbi:hypothetical protein SEVIR_8G151100v4 [Setaria viridis]|uniref:Uncharacterized protein n=2 Tax=Setaria TaxID=4554 RepID=A0A368S7L6_SETIT|nr:hypothetical protein SETIT_8G141300v2 [Setaria italica]TKW01042.1 hypothetical protein SEVIR_8G151100v2 [Setaria viridis]
MKLMYHKWIVPRSIFGCSKLTNNLCRNILAGKILSTWIVYLLHQQLMAPSTADSSTVSQPRLTVLAKGDCVKQTLLKNLSRWNVPSPSWSTRHASIGCRGGAGPSYQGQLTRWSSKFLN